MVLHLRNVKFFMTPTVCIWQFKKTSPHAFRDTDDPSTMYSRFGILQGCHHRYYMRNMDWKHGLEMPID